MSRKAHLPRAFTYTADRAALQISVQRGRVAGQDIHNSCGLRRFLLTPP